MKRWFMTILALMVLLAGHSAANAKMSSDEAADMLAAASEKFRNGAATLDSDREKANMLLSGAIGEYERLIREQGMASGGLYYNVGTAHLMMGDLGRSILNFRRAERLIPGDANLTANLAYARQRVANRVEAPAEERVRRVLLFWHDETTPRTRLIVFVIAYAFAWGWAFFRLMRPGLIGGLWPIVGFAVIALASLGSLVVQHRAEQRNADAVIVSPQSIGRKGPDIAAYEPSFKEPLHSGVEITIVERRPGWLLARLGDGRTTWLPEADVAAVREGAS